MHNTLKKSQSTSFLNPSLSTPNLFAKPLPAKREPTHSHNNQSQIPSTLHKIILSLVHQCCGENLIKESPSGKLLPIQPVYAMPCGHSMCRKCIKTLLEKIPNAMISCSNPECTERYSQQEAENSFIKNDLITSFAEKLWAIYSQQDLIAKENIKSHSGLQFGSRRPNPMQKNSQNIKNGYLLEMEVNMEEESSEGSSEATFNKCVYTFCRTPTIWLFCSERCQKLQDELDRQTQQQYISQNTQNQNEVTI